MCIRSQTTRRIIGQLDQFGIHIAVRKLQAKQYEYCENFEVKRVYRQIKSIHKRIKRKFNQVTNSNN